ncbi:hypothetical protein [Neisseria chenwenguii]|uniref:Uncharacterized protein n=1 Tax=Neisseria chenwenguii TaxID=1853278 RepID=A0A220S253_9NEIS|nr:hypothetical protein [Neisseria chenwenguii]ASK27517.1 hypothetical protein BG910_06955 [Neisseria chenwenguii]ROV55597.1 hypothetical protein EGS38_08800 [Neisseria chenwenguii]
MGQIIELFRTSFSLIFNRKNVKKYLSGEFEPTDEELTQMWRFLRQLLSTDIQNTIENDYSNLLKLQTEHLKTPYLKELSLAELDFLIKNKVDLSSILIFVFAKGGVASISWDNNKQIFIEGVVDAKLRGTILLILICAALALMIDSITKLWSQAVLYWNTAIEPSSKTQNTSIAYTAFTILIIIFIFAVINTLVLGHHTHLAKEKLKKLYPDLFESKFDASPPEKAT